MQLLLPLLRGLDLAAKLRELTLRVPELAALVVQLAQDLVEFLLEGLLLLPEVRAPGGAKAVLGEGLPDGVDLLFDACPRSLQMGDHRREGLQAFCRLGDLLVEGLEGGTLAADFLLECAALPGQLAPVLLVAFLLRVGHGDAVTALESPPAVDRREEVVEREGAFAELVLRPSGEDLVEGDHAVLHRDDVGMDVGRPLVQVYDKRQDVLLPEPAGEDVIHILRPVLDRGTSYDPAVVGTHSQVELLPAEGQLAEPLVRSADDEVRDGPDLRVVWTFLIGVLEPAGGDVLPEQLRDGLALVHGLHLTAPDDLEVQARAGAVDAAVLVCLRPALLGPAPLVLVALRGRESLPRLEVDDLFLCFHLARVFRVIFLPFLRCPACCMSALRNLTPGQVGIKLPPSLRSWQTGKPAAKQESSFEEDFRGRMGPPREGRFPARFRHFGSRPDSGQAPGPGPLLEVRKVEVVQKERESLGGLLDREIVQGDELPEEGGHRMAVPAPVDGQLGDRDGERTGVVFRLLRIVHRLPLHQVVEGLVLGVPVLGLLVEGVCQFLRQGVDIVRALASRLRGCDSFHVCSLFIGLSVPHGAWHLWVEECQLTVGTFRAEIHLRDVLRGPLDLLFHLVLAHEVDGDHPRRVERRGDHDHPQRKAQVEKRRERHQDEEEGEGAHEGTPVVVKPSEDGTRAFIRDKEHHEHQARELPRARPLQHQAAEVHEEDLQGDGDPVVEPGFRGQCHQKVESREGVRRSLVEEREDGVDGHGHEKDDCCKECHVYGWFD